VSRIGEDLMVSLARVTGVHAWAQTLVVLLLAALLLAFHRIYRRPYLLHWGLSWLALAAYFLGGTVAGLVAPHLPPTHVARLALSTVIVLGGYWQVVWLLSGLYEFATGVVLSRRLLAWALGISAAFSVGVVALLALVDVSLFPRYFLRVGVRAGLAGIAYLVAAGLLLRVPRHAGSLGRRLMAGALLAFGAQQLQNFAQYAGLVSDPWLSLVAAIVDLVVQGVMGVAMIVWLLEEERQRVVRSSQAQRCVYRISEAVRSTFDLPQLFAAIHAALAEILPARNFYIALFDPEQRLLSFPYFVDEHDETPSPRPLGKGLTEYVLRTRGPLLATPERFDELVASGEVEPLASPSVDWLGAPLRTAEKAIGVIAVQSYDERVRLSGEDLRLLVYVSEQVASAIEAKRAEAARGALIHELEARNAELERFTYTVSHDLKSPLVTIRGFAGLIERALSDKDRRGPGEGPGRVDQQATPGEAGPGADDGSVLRDVSRISEAAARMDHLLNELLELSRIGRIVNPPQTLGFGAIASEAAAMVHGALTQRGVRLVIEPELPTVYGDRVRILEVVQNLIENAVKFMGTEPQPRIEIGARASTDRMAVLYVRDNGIGIEERFHDRIFRLFDKLDAQSPGTGVGLALVRRIVEVHGGRIWVESDGVGRGASFVFTLPTGPVPPPR
jgi:signal transduction histidine kinase